MEKEYVFVFPGTKDEFVDSLMRFHHRDTYSGAQYIYFADYIVKFVGEEIHFGVARGGHSGGYWFVPAVTERDGGIEFRGAIRYIGPEGKNKGRFKEAMENIEMALVFVLVLPILLLVWLYLLGERLVRKIIKRPKPKEKSNEERLFELMEHYLGCSPQRS